ncbi:MAG TPA: serine protease [Burkholderiales bacterium]|nr:serine protease [Burkholderiales bacterium]
MTGMKTWAGLLLAVLLVVFAQSGQAQSLDRQKAAVVRVTSQSEGLRRTGSGFIVQLEPDAAYIVTASHVVEGDSRPRVEFFTRRNTLISAETVRIEGGDPRGLALLVVRGKENLPSGLTALSIASGTELRGGEPVTVIGFPQGGGSWAVLRANIVALEGRELTLDGSIGEGNSGGPVLRGETVVGIVTTVGGAGGFGHAVPGTLVRLVLDGWGVQATTASGTKDTTVRREAPSSAREPGTPAREPTAPTPEPAPSAREPVTSFDSSKASVRIARAYCEKLRATTGFRITLYGEGHGPEGGAVRASFLRDGKELSRPKISCASWKDCQRNAGDPDKTDWKISVMTLAPAPTDAAVSLQPTQGGTIENAFAVARTQLDCLLQ